MAKSDDPKDKVMVAELNYRTAEKMISDAVATGVFWGGFKLSLFTSLLWIFVLILWRNN